MATSSISLRLDTQMKRRVANIARRRHSSTSEVLREAVAAWVAKEEQPVSAYEKMKDFIGVIHGGDPRRSEDIGRKVSEMLIARHKRSKS